MTMTHPTKMFYILFFCCLLNFVNAFAVTRYVRPEPTGLGMGISWESASSDLHAMLNASEPGDEVWVSAGTYYPTDYPTDCINCSSPRDYTFFVPDGVKLYGGFAGFETDTAQRNLSTNITTLSGNIGTVSSSSDNCYHVLLAVAPSIGGIGVTIDGFTVTHGYGGYSSEIVVNSNSIPRSSGAGIHIRGGTNQITNNKINNCNAFNSGGIIIWYGVSTVIANNTIRENTGQVGGGVTIIEGNNTIINNNISDNILSCCAGMVGNNGAGINISAGLGNNVISGNTISGNRSYEGSGAGIHISGGTNLVVNNIIADNSIESSGWGGGTSTCLGGGISTWNGNNTITGNIIMGNVSYEGGGIAFSYGTNNFINNIIFNNSANHGGGIMVRYSTYNCANNSIVSNTATISGGGIYTVNTGSNAFTNNILWDNKKGTSTNIPGADYFHESGTVGIFNHNLFQLTADNYTTENTGNYALGAAASGNLFGQNPMFVNSSGISGLDGLYLTADDGLRLTAYSPAINAGSVIGAPDTDILGNIRTDVPDLGAYERAIYTLSTSLYVDASISESGNGESWETALTTLTQALMFAHSCPWVDTINVAAGTYTPGKKPFNYDAEITTPDWRDLTFHIPDGLVLLGGYPNGGGTRNALAHTTILSGDIGIAGNVADNAYHVVIAHAPASGGSGVVLDGFTISGGNSNGTSSLYLANGASYYRSNGSGIFLINGNNKILGNTFNNNVSTNNGGAIYTSSGKNMISNNVLVGNSARQGGAIYANTGVNTLQNNIVLNNTADIFGGGINLYYGNNTVSNNIIGQNAAEYGGGIYNSLGSNLYTNNTIVSNTANYMGGGLYTNNGSDTLTNNVFYDNKLGVSNTIQGADYYNYNGANTFIHNLLQLPDNNYTSTNTGNYGIGTEATGNLFALNPMFVNLADIDGNDNEYRTEDDGLRLLEGSPAVNAGVANINTPLTDILSNTRDLQPDLGAYEGEVPVGVKLQSAPYSTHFTAYPNPGGDIITLAFTTPNADYIIISLIDMHGCNIAQLFAGSTQPYFNHTVALDVSQLPTGTYFAILRRTNGNGQQIPIIVSR